MRIESIEKIRAEIHKELDGGNWSGGWYERPEEVAETNFNKILDKAIEDECSEWVDIINGTNYDWATCRKCGGRTMMARRYYPFCPNCGRYMRGNEE